MDSFAVSLGAGTTRTNISPRPMFRISFHLGLFQAGLTVLGWLAGNTIERFIAPFDHWIILGLLLWVGGRMIREGLSKEDECQHTLDLSRGFTLITICVATSLDAVAVGLSMGVMNLDILLTSLIIFVVTLLFSLTGLLTGNKLGARFGKRMEVIGGLVLIGIGVQVILEHTMLA